MRTRVAVALVFAILSSAFLLTDARAQQSPPVTTSSLLVKVVGGLSTEQQAQVVARNGGTLVSSIAPLRLLVVSVSTADRAAVLESYQADPQVQSVEENKVRVSESTPSDLLYANQWALPKIGWDQVFGVVDPAGSAKVALLDTGVDAAHPELSDKVLPGMSVLDGSNGMTDPSGHGTWLAGIIAAQTNTVPGDGIAGIAYAGVKILPVTVLNANGEGQDSDVIAGVIWAVDNGADVILMAFSNPGFSPNLQDAVDYAWSKNVIVVAAVGNNASAEPTFPAGDRGVMGVAATDQGDGLASFSNAGQAVFIAAPGVDIQTVDIGDAYTVISGTSTSAAIIAASAALMKAMDPSLTNGIIVGRLARNADPAGTQDQTGNGRVNLPRALADTSLESVQPAGAAPLGTGGPFVGPYQAATVSGLNITAPTAASPATVLTSALPATLTVSFTYNSNGSTTITARIKSGLTIIATNTSTGLPAGSGGGTAATINVTLPVGTAIGNYDVELFGTTGSGSDKTDTETGAVRVRRESSTSVTCSTPRTVGQASSCTVTVMDSSSGPKIAPTGTFNIIASGASVSPTSASCALAGGPTNATCTVSFTGNAAGTIAVSAVYPGDANHSGSSGSASITVTAQAATNLTVAPATGGYGGTVNLSATLTSAGTPVSGKPIGFALNGVSVGSATTDTNGIASLNGVNLGTIAATTYPSGVTATFAGDTNFTLSTGTAALTVNKATLTVTADDKSREYGDGNPAFTAGYSGFKNGESFATSGVTGSPSLTTTATAASPVGSYTITAALGSLAATNYQFAFVNGTLTITKATLTVTADNKSREYGDPNPTFTASYSGFKNGESLATSGVTGSPSLTTTATAASSAGSYTITAALGSLAATNYQFAFINGTLTITKATLTVTADNKSREYGDPNPAFTASYSGFKNGETLATSGVTGSASLTTAATAASGVGSYTITASLGSLAAINYQFAFVNATLTVTKATLTVLADSQTKVLNAPNPALTVSYSGFKNGEVLATSGVTGAPVVTTTAMALSAVGSYPISVSLGTLTAANYTFAFTAGTLTILYAPAGVACSGDMGHQILQPIDVSGASVFKQKSTVPAKFRVCDANGISIGSAGVVTAFNLVQIINGTAISGVNEQVDSTTPDTAFRWDPTAQQWIFNISTKSLSANMTYIYRLTLNDGSEIRFQYGLK